jgi:hypothetical protein
MGRALLYETSQEVTTGIDLCIYTNNRSSRLLQQTEPGSTMPVVSYFGLPGDIPCLGDMLLQPICAPSFLSASVIDDAVLQSFYHPYMSNIRKDSHVKITRDVLGIAPNETWRGTKISITRDRDLLNYLDAKTLQQMHYTDHFMQVLASLASRRDGDETIPLPELEEWCSSDQNAKLLVAAAERIGRSARCDGWKHKPTERMQWKNYALSTATR